MYLSIYVSIYLSIYINPIIKLSWIAFSTIHYDRSPYESHKLISTNQLSNILYSLLICIDYLLLLYSLLIKCVNIRDSDIAKLFYGFTFHLFSRQATNSPCHILVNRIVLSPVSAIISFVWLLRIWNRAIYRISSIRLFIHCWNANIYVLLPQFNKAKAILNR